MDFKTKYMIGLEERISLTEKITILHTKLRVQENINNDLLKHINKEKYKCPNCDAGASNIVPKTLKQEVPLDQTIMPPVQDSEKDDEQLATFENHPVAPNVSDSEQNSTISLPKFSGKKPFDYNQLSNFDRPSDSESNAPSEKSEKDEIDLDDDKLVPWSRIVRQNHPKLLKADNQSAWEKYVLEFLDDRLDKMAYNKCYIYRDGSFTWGIPDELASDFEDFFEKMVVEGTVERLKNVKKKTPLCTPIAKNNHSKSKVSSAKSGGKSSGKSRRSSGPIVLSNFAGYDTQKTPSKLNSVNSFLPWIDLVKEKLPHVSIDLAKMSEIAKSFLELEKLPEKKTKSSSGVLCVGIPAGFADDFIQKILVHIASQEEALSPIAKLLNNPSISHKHIDGEYFFCWRDLAIEKFKDDAPMDPRTILFDNITNGVQDFLKKNSTISSWEDIKIRSFHGGRSTYGIPFSLINQFYEWYAINLRRGFKDYELAESNESLKHCLDAVSGSRPKKIIKMDQHPRSEDRGETEFETFVRQFPVEPSPFAVDPVNDKNYTSNVLTSIDMVFNDKENDKPNLTVYTDILSGLMPSFTNLPISDRQAIKKHVESYISQKLGSSARIVENIISRISDSGQIIATFGIPSEWHADFKKWGLYLLRRMYGIENVPLHAWESVNVEIF